jgi:choline dehydrogenase-like flavoprotein
MGALWNCIVPRFEPTLERWPGIPAADWDDLYARAERLLAASRESAAASRHQAALLRALAGRPGRQAQEAPVAASPLEGAGPSAPPRWTGPAEILGGASARFRGRLRFLSQYAVRRLRHRAGRVVCAEAVATDGGDRIFLNADKFLVAAGGIGTPALLWASGIFAEDGEDSPVGRYLSDHPLAYGRIALDPDLMSGADSTDAAGLDGDPGPCVMIPMSPQRPIHSVMLCDADGDAAVSWRLAGCRVLSMYWYALSDQRFENRLRFQDGATDALGLPRPTFEYSLSPAEDDAAQAALADLRATGALAGTFLPASPPQRLSAGSSMHIMGTTRMGERDDGHSVADANGGVWRFTNLYIGGTGLIPTASATNPTLTACAVAVRTADHIISSRTTRNRSEASPRTSR